MVQLFGDAAGNNGLLVRMQVARIEEEIVVLGLMIADDDRRIARCQPVCQIPRRNACDVRVDVDPQAIERVAGRVRRDARSNAGPSLKRLGPKIYGPRLRMVFRLYRRARGLSLFAGVFIRTMKAGALRSVPPRGVCL